MLPLLNLLAANYLNAVYLSNLLAANYLNVICCKFNNNYFLLQTTHAAANFAGILNPNFAYLHCWEIMKDEPKWPDPKPRAFAKSAGGDGFGEDTINLGHDNSSPTGSAKKRPINLGHDNSSPTRSAENRPMGRNSAKAAKKRANSSAEFSIIFGVCFKDARSIFAKDFYPARRICA
jgi:hypothetical protein